MTRDADQLCDSACLGAFDDDGDCDFDVRDFAAFMRVLTSCPNAETPTDSAKPGKPKVHFRWQSRPIHH